MARDDLGDAATFMEVLDTAIASVALPYIAGSLSATTSEATWVLTSYLVANAVILPASNWFSAAVRAEAVPDDVRGDFYGGVVLLRSGAVAGRDSAGARGAGRGRRRAAAAVAGDSAGELSAGEARTAMAAFALGIVVAPVMGPTLGGWLTDTFSWRYAFYINIPVGILAVIMIGLFVHDPPYIKNAKVSAFDNIGFGLLIVWTGCLQVVLDKGQEDDWFGATWVRWAMAAAVFALIGWIWRSWTHPGACRSACFEKSEFSHRLFADCAAGLCIYITITILPLCYQEVLGYTALKAGWWWGRAASGRSSGR